MAPVVHTTLVATALSAKAQSAVSDITQLSETQHSIATAALLPPVHHVANTPVEITHVTALLALITHTI